MLYLKYMEEYSEFGYPNSEVWIYGYLMWNFAYEFGPNTDSKWQRIARNIFIHLIGSSLEYRPETTFRVQFQMPLTMISIIYSLSSMTVHEYQLHAVY